MQGGTPECDGSIEFCDCKANQAGGITETQERDGELHHSWQAGQARFPAFLDDYAAYVAALIDSYETGFEEARLRSAKRWTAHVLEEFSDAQLQEVDLLDREAHQLRGVLVAVEEIEVQEAVVGEEEVASVNLRAEPTFTPFTVAPSITNRQDVIATMVREYPPLLRDAGIGGTVRVYFFINEGGIVEQVRLDQSSGHEALDDAALNVAGAYEFSPAMNDEEPVPVWVSFPITFQVN